MLIDLDRFKDINDTLGHHYGDEVLRQMSGRLTELLDPRDTVARLGGDEFAVLLRSARSAAEGMAVAAAIRRALAQPFDAEGVSLELGGSIGVAVHPEDGDDVETLMQRADVAMYQAKEGATGVERYSVAAGRLEPRPPRARGRPAPRAREERVRPLLPAQDRPAHRRGRRRRGAAALEPPHAGERVARRLHPARRADRPDRAGHAAGDLGGDPRVQPLARPRPRRPVAWR